MIALIIAAHGVKFHSSGANSSYQR
jgi:hypothetical protein